MTVESEHQPVPVVFNVAFEAWSEGGGSTLGPMGNPLRPGAVDTNAMSWGNYGARRGIWRLLEVLDRTGVHATVFVSGCLVERVPDAVSAVASAGHDICCHGYAQDMIPTFYEESEERELIRRCKGLLGDLLGAAPLGWISPRGTPSLRTCDLLLEEGFQWHGDCYDDDVPYVERRGGRKIVAVPLTTQVNDLAVLTRHGNPPRAMLENFSDALSARLEARSNQGQAAGHLDVLGHTHVSGRPLEAWIYEQIAATAASNDQVEIVTKSQLARRVLDA